MKKIFLLFSLLLGVLSAWAYDVEVDGIYYNLDKENKTASVTYKKQYSSDYEGTVIIPATISAFETAYSVTSLGNSCFYDCTGLTVITLPNSVTSLGESCFYGCTNLTEVHVNRETPPATGSGIFYGCESLETIYVPTGASADYGIDPWNAYKIVEEEMQSGITAVTVKGETAAPVYQLNGSRTGTAKNFNVLPKGIYIENGKKVLR